MEITDIDKESFKAQRLTKCIHTSQLNSISASMVITLTLKVFGCFFFNPRIDILRVLLSKKTVGKKEKHNFKYFKGKNCFHDKT